MMSCWKATHFFTKKFRRLTSKAIGKNFLKGVDSFPPV